MGRVARCRRVMLDEAHAVYHVGLFLEHLGLESLDQLPPLAPFLPERETTNVPDGE